MTGFSEFFRQATGQEPYPYQTAYAELPVENRLLRIPTGAGKTATAILVWLWQRKINSDNTPRRLAYCLPMRVLVEQTAQNSRDWIANLQSQCDLHVLMGGVEAGDWYLHPERTALLIGTQDMLLSRALNRGYGSSRFHWPIDFALLNNDCMWVFDEPQLMANGVSTSAQLAGFRASLKTHGTCPSVWMSATLEPTWLRTVDFQDHAPTEPLELTTADYDERFPLYTRMTAQKKLQRAKISAKEEKEVAKKVWDLHLANQGQSLVVLNTVERARKVYEELAKLRNKATTPELLLIHSRFRPVERNRLNEQLQAKGEEADNRIIIATQVVEAGVDISARTLVSDLAPWSSMVQRMGRCNRTGDDGPGQVVWLDLEEKHSAPYEASDLSAARDWLNKLEGKDVSPQALAKFQAKEKIELPFEHRFVIRCRDLFDLFDTTPDLSGNDIDIARYVRSNDPDTDVQVFWRNLTEPRWGISPVRDELCSVSLKGFFDFLKSTKPKAMYWDHLDDEWKPLTEREVRPGLTILLPHNAGGYSETLGWDPKANTNVQPLPPQDPREQVKPESADDDPLATNAAKELTIVQHTKNVCVELENVLKKVPISEEQQAQLSTAALWHDLGKAHATYQAAMYQANQSLTTDYQWAKSGTKGRLIYQPKYFRHELVSALVAMQQNLPFEVAYLIAAHHGKVRLSIRALPDEIPPDAAEQLFALGARQGDVLPETRLNEATVCPETTIDLSPLQLGGEQSWTARALELLHQLGPFQLAYLETLLRAADMRASREESQLKGAMHE